MTTADELVLAFEKWFQEEFPARKSYETEEELTRHLLSELAAWLRTNFPDCKVFDMRGNSYVQLFGHGYEADLELRGGDQWRIPAEVKLMKDGWEINQAIGQALMYSRRPGASKALAAAVAVGKASEKFAFRRQERSLQDELWQKLGIRLCIRNAQSSYERAVRILQKADTDTRDRLLAWLKGLAEQRKVG